MTDVPAEFLPSAGFTDLDSLGAIFVNSATSIDLRAAVQAVADIAPDGRTVLPDSAPFVVHDADVALRLEEYPPVERIA